MGYTPPLPPIGNHATNPFTEKRGLRPLLCPQCGAPLRNERECDYCGVRFTDGTTRNFPYTFAINGPDIAKHHPGISARAFEESASARLLERFRRGVEIEKEQLGRALLPAFQKVIKLWS
jgi:hypothetical protein